jgi:carbonic anhydrase
MRPRSTEPKPASRRIILRPLDIPSGTSHVLAPIGPRLLGDPNMLRCKFLCLVVLTVTAAGCDQVGANKTTNHKKKSPAVASASAAAGPSASAPIPHPSGAPPHAVASAELDVQSHRYALPFAWENSDNEPLARTREFVKDALRDNQDYMKRGPKFFDAFAKVQRPRSTVVACSDSRVQNAAWDLTPENDDFTIRNVGNQIVTSEGSVEYGVEHLGTAVLLVVGHTGCGAVKAAMGDKAALSPALRREIDTLVLPNELLGQNSDTAWTQAVIANLNAQVKTGLSQFGRYVAEGRLTVIGAIYDFRNDLGKGAGRLSIINVNGNSEPSRLNAFVAAVTGSKAGADTSSKSGPSLDTSASAEQIAKSIENLPGLRSGAPGRP